MAVWGCCVEEEDEGLNRNRGVLWESGLARRESVLVPGCLHSKTGVSLDPFFNEVHVRTHRLAIFYFREVVLLEAGKDGGTRDGEHSRGRGQALVEHEVSSCQSPDICSVSIVKESGTSDQLDVTGENPES